MKIKTYTECDFLDRIFSNVPNNTFSEMFLSSDNDISNWKDMLDLLFRKSELSLSNCKMEEIVQKAKVNPFYQKLIDHSSTGSKLVFSNEVNSVEINWNKFPLGSIHCYSKNATNQPDNFLVCNNDNWKELIPKLSSPMTFQVSQNEKNNTFPGWNFLELIKIPCDSAIIFDRYILKNPSDLDKNLFQILKNIIPAEKDAEFQLTIMAKKSECQDFLSSKNKIESFLNRIYKSRVKVGFVLADRDLPHDREILTNYYRISSGNSFNYYSNQNKLIVNTKLDFIPVLSTDYKNYISKLNELMIFVQGNTEKHGGLKRNKLFEVLSQLKVG